MLVLSRQKNEDIVIDLSELDLSQLPKDQQQVRIRIVDIRANKVRVGIQAHKDIPCHRGEVQEAIEAESRTGPKPVTKP